MFLLPFIFFVLATFNVQNLYISQSNEMVNITCTFAKGSFADGCTVTFNSTLTVNITKPNGSNIATVSTRVSEGLYYIDAYDIMNEERSDFVAVELIDPFTFTSVFANSLTQDHPSSTQAVVSTSDNNKNSLYISLSG